MQGNSDTFFLTEILWNGSPHKVVSFNFPTGHVAMSVIKSTDGRMMVLFHEMEDYHVPGSKPAKEDVQKAHPTLGVIFDDVNSIRAVADNLMGYAKKFTKGMENEEKPAE